MTNQKQIRDAFWSEHPDFDHQARAAGIRSKPQNEQCATVRCAFVDFVDHLQRSGRVSVELVGRATL